MYRQRPPPSMGANPLMLKVRRGERPACRQDSGAFLVNDLMPRTIARRRFIAIHASGPRQCFKALAERIDYGVDGRLRRLVSLGRGISWSSWMSSPGCCISGRVQRDSQRKSASREGRGLERSSAELYSTHLTTFGGTRRGGPLLTRDPSLQEKLRQASQP